MKTDLATTVYVALISLACVGMTAMCYAESEDQNEDVGKTIHIFPAGHELSKEEPEVASAPAQVPVSHAESALKTTPPKKSLPDFKRTTNRTGPTVENKSEAQTDENVDLGIIAEHTPMHSEHGPVPGEGASKNQLPDFKPVSSKTGPVAVNSNAASSIGD